MANISSAGIGSGLDVNAIVTQLMALERRPLEQLQTVTDRYNTQISAFGKLQSAMTTLRDAARKLTDTSNWTATNVASSNAAAVSATANGSGPPGSYSVAVSKLAVSQTLVGSSSFTDATSAVGSGTLTIELGRWGTDAGTGSTTFEPKAGASAVTVTIEPGKETLADVRDAINTAGAGVTASIVNDANGARLALRSTATGETNAFRIGVGDGDGNDTDASGLSQVAYDPSQAGGSQMLLKLAAANAAATINGVDIESESNELSDVLDGLSLKLLQTTTEPVTLGVTRDTEAIKKSITDFATAYSDLQKLLREQTKYNEGTKTAGTLQGDRSAVGLMSQLRTLVAGSSAASAAFTRLADIGLSPQADGTLKVDTTKLDGAVARLDELKTFFSRNEDGTASDGFGVLLRDFGSAAIGAEGVLTTRQDGLKDRISRNNDQASRLEDRLALTEKRLRDQYSRLDTNMARLTQLQGYISQQVTNWNKSA